jgi:GTP-binding protein HflX
MRGVFTSAPGPRPFLKGRSESTRAPAQRAIAAALLLPGRAGEGAQDPMEEIIGLAEAAGARVLDSDYQRRDRPDARTAFGKGKVEELGVLCKQHEAELLIVDNDLSPSQARNLEEEVCVRVVDRTELILDIFASRARTREARWQVELAQMQYLRPRLMRMWTHLERTEGAIGARGPGETQLETDRRLVDQRIYKLRSRLKEVEKRSLRRVAERGGLVAVSLVGYTNAGKSTLLNRLTGSGVEEADRLFATLDTKVSRWKLAAGHEVQLSDTVGFVRDLPHDLVASFTATLEETRSADLLLHVCDAAHPDLEIRMRAVENVIEEMGASETPVLLVLNRGDLLDVAECRALESHWPEALVVSAKTGQGLDALTEEVGKKLDAWTLHLEIRVPAGEGRLISQLKSLGKTEEEGFEDDTWWARLRLPPAIWQSIQSALEKAGGTFQSLS